MERLQNPISKGNSQCANRGRYTPINMEHNNEGLEDDFPLHLVFFEVPC